jgi:hypothetical protein
MGTAARAVKPISQSQWNVGFRHNSGPEVTPEGALSADIVL